MKSVIATVSGYHGLERFNLIRLISLMGANYVGAMSRSTTHLVCWKFEGRKYNLAKKFKILIVNHRWVEECAKQGRHVPEGPYILQSGLEVGPLQFEVPVVRVSALNKNKEVLSEQLNICDGSGEELIETHSGGSGNALWVDSCLLTEHAKASSHSATNLVREKRRVSNGKESNTSAGPHKARRLVKKTVSREILEPIFSDSGQVRVHIPSTTDFAAPSNHSDGLGNISILETGGRLDYGLDNNAGSLTDSSENFESNKERNCLPPTDSNLGVEDAPIDLERTSHYEVSNDKNLKEGIKDGDIRLPNSGELSCVICWTDFSSSRAVLPCGHRFCYSCIQNWADHMVSRRKISTCPLCKASFVSITKFVDTATSDQKIFSQTIPHCPSTDIFILPGQETSSSVTQSSPASVCSECRSREPEDCLISCHLCRIRCIHSYCLDPPLLPWTCIHCKDLQMLYHHAH